MQRMVWAVLIGFAAALAVGPWTIRELRKLKAGQNIYELAPESHKSKQGTPTMGGLAFAALTLLIGFALRTGPFDIKTDMPFALAVFALMNMALGFTDDFTKLRMKHNQGLTEKQKLAAQFIIAALFTVYCYMHPDVGSTIYIPFFKTEWDMGWFYIPAMMFVIICTTNGCNLLDGLDGLCGGVSSVGMATFAVLALLFASAAQSAALQTNLINVGILCAALCGSLLGYLRFNLHPAQVMMGDTGSMFLGGMCVGTAMLMRQPLLILLIGGAYAASLLSVFLQRMYFKATHGKRIFKMSPLHHHFELCGVPETRIVSMYVIASVLLCLLALLGVTGA